MCITLKDSELGTTQIVALRDHTSNEHVILYKNSPVDKNQSNIPQGNAMILPLPLREGSTFGKANFLPSIPKGVMNIALDSVPQPWRPKTRSASSTNYTKSIQSFDVGIYRVVVAINPTPDEVRQALTQVPKEKRPIISLEFLRQYKENVGGSFLLACYNSKTQTDAEPIGYRYEPRDFQLLEIPAIDGHGLDKDEYAAYGTVGDSEVVIQPIENEENDMPALFDRLEIPDAILDSAANDSKPSAENLGQIESINTTIELDHSTDSKQLIEDTDSFLSKTVHVHHSIVIGVEYENCNGGRANYTDALNKISDPAEKEMFERYLPKLVIGRTFIGELPNGNFVMDFNNSIQDEKKENATLLRLNGTVYDPNDKKTFNTFLINTLHNKKGHDFSMR